MFEEASVLEIANRVGKAIQMDPITIEMIKACYARVCIELDLNDLLPPNMLIWGRKQANMKVFYHICFMYQKYGHKKEYYPITSKPSGKVNNKSEMASRKTTGSTTTQTFGPCR